MLTSIADAVVDSNTPTSRGGSPPVFGVAGRRRTGYDTVKVVARVGREALAFRSDATHLDRDTGVLTPRSARGYETLPCGVALQSSAERPGRFSFEFSVPRLVTGSNVTPAMGADLLRAMHQVRDEGEGEGLVDWLDSPED